MEKMSEFRWDFPKMNHNAVPIQYQQLITLIKVEVKSAPLVANTTHQHASCCHQNKAIAHEMCCVSRRVQAKCDCLTVINNSYNSPWSCNRKKRNSEFSVGNKNKFSAGKSDWLCQPQ